MLICRVEGSAVSTIHHPTLRGWRQLLCQPIDETNAEIGDPILVADVLGAGMHQHILVTSDGKSVREAVGDPHTPMRYMSVAVLDSTEPVQEEVSA